MHAVRSITYHAWTCSLIEGCGTGTACGTVHSVGTACGTANIVSCWDLFLGGCGIVDNVGTACGTVNTVKFMKKILKKTFLVKKTNFGQNFLLSMLFC